MSKLALEAALRHLRWRGQQHYCDESATMSPSFALCPAKAQLTAIAGDVHNCRLGAQCCQVWQASLCTFQTLCHMYDPHLYVSERRSSEAPNPIYMSESIAHGLWHCCPAKRWLKVLDLHFDLITAHLNSTLGCGLLCNSLMNTYHIRRDSVICRGIYKQELYTILPLSLRHDCLSRWTPCWRT